MSAAPAFATTRWSLILTAKGRACPEARQALAELCALYWYPLYAYLRRAGHADDQAQDLTQEFFARLLASSLRPRCLIGASVLRVVAGVVILFQYLINYGQRGYLFGPDAALAYDDFARILDALPG